MATYVIGDVQGCYDELCRLLQKLRFDPANDRAWFTGDLVNRGPHSLKVLRLVRGLGARAVTVLGNHDLHLVSAALTGSVRRKDTFQDVLEAPDRDPLICWLRRQPLLHEGAGIIMVHAGLPPQWSLRQARTYCAEAQRLISDRRGEVFLKQHMYGDEPNTWSDDLTGWPRRRFIVNCFTRLRYVDANGHAVLKEKGAPQSVTDVLGGHVRLNLGSIPPLLPHIRASRLRAMGVSSLKRVPQLPDLPTISEAGVPGYEFSAWFGMVAPAKVAPPVITRLHDTVTRALRSPETATQFETQGAIALGNTPAEFGAYIKREYDGNARIVKVAGLKIE